jgi:hypothetical protein
MPARRRQPAEKSFARHCRRDRRLDRGWVVLLIVERPLGPDGLDLGPWQARRGFTSRNFIDISTLPRRCYGAVGPWTTVLDYPPRYTHLLERMSPEGLSREARHRATLAGPESR